MSIDPRDTNLTPDEWNTLTVYRRLRDSLTRHLEDNPSHPEGATPSPPGAAAVSESLVRRERKTNAKYPI